MTGSHVSADISRCLPQIKLSAKARFKATNLEVNYLCVENLQVIKNTVSDKSY